MYLVTQNLYFPPVEEADKTGILALGGDLSVPRLLLAYRSGIFPWYNEDEPIIWWAPPKRMVVYPEHYSMHKSMRNVFNQHKYTVTFNKAFQQVIIACKDIYRKDQQGTWITQEIIDAYTHLYELGLARSVRGLEGRAACRRTLWSRYRQWHLLWRKYVHQVFQRKQGGFLYALAGAQGKKTTCSWTVRYTMTT